ncbi:hypothetical protein B0T26DRAFT_206966 [Lasiosphaeria miniovina]|uniref:Uncharacterized protein n=1 Tax=Lasiosphaeria miniovina TaxID=1954250 RepID=A0AA40AUE5_9PEZI|nr:uncharacterized protein B0T26DRAFT_206966 [Lasiosphaeria miniovina]KAK0722192.1 hypothetical protein B0T26DRAFT_206966 [Lasiosphaeria miniovina]
MATWMDRKVGIYEPTFVSVLGLLRKVRWNGDRFQGRSVRYRSRKPTRQRRDGRKMGQELWRGEHATLGGHQTRPSNAILVAGVCSGNR